MRHIRHPYLPLGLLALVGLPLLSGCAVGPDYQRPTVPTPAVWQTQAWQPAEPRGPQVRAAWWEIYGDARLNDLAAQVTLANQDLLAAEARYRQAQALLSAAQASYFPSLDASLGSTRRQNSPASARSTQHTLALEALWEIDVWGRLRRQVEANRANAQASAADLAAARLSAQAALVQSYLQLRINDARQRLLTATVSNYERALTITRNRYQGGVASQADVAQAETQLKTAQVQATDLLMQGEQLEHAIALLLGKLPGEVRIAQEPTVPALPVIPAGLPSTLLEQRPDVAAAERRVASANAGIGVAQAAYFPSLTLGASGGYQGPALAGLVSTPQRFWALGPAALALNLVDGGRISARKRQALAIHDESVASYRQTVLAAFAEVEDKLTALRFLATEKGLQDEATQAARRFQELTNNQYLAGTVSYLNVAIANASALAAERDSLNVLNQQLLASVQLAKALGGGDWRRDPQLAP